MKGIGGAMDLCSGVRRVVIATTHCTRDGQPKIVRECTLPLTGQGVADMIITELAVFKVRKGRSLLLVELHAGVSVEEIRSKTAADFEVSQDLAEMRFSPMNRKHAPLTPAPGLSGARADSAGKGRAEIPAASPRRPHAVRTRRRRRGRRPAPAAVPPQVMRWWPGGGDLSRGGAQARWNGVTRSLRAWRRAVVESLAHLGHACPGKGQWPRSWVEWATGR